MRGRRKKPDVERAPGKSLAVSEWLDPLAKECWARIPFDSLDITEADRSIVESYCQSYARWRQLEADVTARGQIISGKLNPACRQLEQAKRELRATCTELGFSPRSRIFEAPSPADPFDNFDS